MLQKAIRRAKSNKSFQVLTALAVIAAISAIGVHVLSSSHAATPYASGYAANGTVGGTTSLVSGGSNSSGQAVQFGTNSSASSFVTASGTNLMLNGKVWNFIGFNAYGIEGCWNGSSGSVWTDAELDAYFSGLPANGLTRIWAPVYDGTSELSDIVTQAAKYNQHVVFSIGNDDGNCDPTSDDPNQTGEPPSFYEGAGVAGSDWSNVYVPWVNTLAALFKNSPTIAMWEIANEPGQNASVSESVMQTYLTDSAKAIHAADPNHLVESGVSEAGNMNYQNEGNETDEQNAESSPYVNVLSYHDYSYDYEGGAMLSGNFTDAQTAARNLNKPFIAGEAGVEGCTNPSGNAPEGPYFSLSQRATWFQTKANDLFRGTGPNGTASPGVAGIMFWDYVPEAQGQCQDYDYDIGPGDPTLTMVKNYVVP